jgi:hypothetical protein
LPLEEEAEELEGVDDEVGFDEEGAAFVHV